MADWQRLSGSEVLDKFKVTKERGLSNSVANKKLEANGKNSLVEKKKKSILLRFLNQFSDFMVIILLIAACISIVTSIIEGDTDYIDAIIILSIVVVNAIIGVVQECKAEKAIEALKKLSSPKAEVIRNSRKISILSENLVPGDIIVLSTGSLVPADCRLLETYNFKVEESSLTGESSAVLKDADVICSPNVSLAEMRNMAFSGSTVSSGRAIAIVVETGMNTQVGKIAHMINTEDSPQTPLQLKLQKMSQYLGTGALIACLIIFILGLFQKIPPLEMFMLSISLAVAAIPEGLPAVVTIVLAMGVRRMAMNRAIIRKLPAVETLGSANVICSDKTGTLTQNKMTVTTLADYNGKVNFSSSKGSEILELASLCNNATLENKKGAFKSKGDPTETSIILAAAKVGKFKYDLDKMFVREREIPFDSSRKLMTTIHKLNNGKYRIITKGAPDILLNKASNYSDGKLNNTIKNNILKENEKMAQEALRVIAVCYKDVDRIPSSISDIESNLTFVGLIGMIDPPRPQVKRAVKECLKAGIKPVMITGDHIVTAKAIASEIGIFRHGDKSMTGEQLQKISQRELERDIFKYSVFARVSPEHKVRIVKAFQKNKAVVAMTGDGVNDAPALKAADIGCAMGLTGTDVAKGAADMILTDDNFSTIVEAVKQGRGIFDNIKKTIHFLLSSNIGEIITVMTAFLLRLPTPLLAIQLLWVNLVTDSFPALALGVEPVDEDIMSQKPIGVNEGLFSSKIWRRIALEGAFIGGISILAFTIGRVFFDKGFDPFIGRTMAFTVLSLSQIVHSFNVRSQESIFKTGVFGNPKMILSFIACFILQISVVSIESISTVFKTAQLNDIQWIIVLLLSFSPILLVEIEKLISKKEK